MAQCRAYKALTQLAASRSHAPRSLHGAGPGTRPHLDGDGQVVLQLSYTSHGPRIAATTTTTAGSALSIHQRNHLRSVVWLASLAIHNYPLFCPSHFLKLLRQLVPAQTCADQDHPRPPKTTQKNRDQTAGTCPATHPSTIDVRGCIRYPDQGLADGAIFSLLPRFFSFDGPCCFPSAS